MMHKTMTFGTFGSTRDDVLATDFYGFFHFAEATQVATDDGGTTASYRTCGGFRELVVLQVAADAGGLTDWLSLQVARTFVDDPQNGVFARDVIASFIREGVAGQGYEDSFALVLRELLTQPLRRRWEVSYTDSNPVPQMPRLPGDFRPVLSVCGGGDATFSAQLAYTDLRMSNDRFDGVGALTVSFHRQSGSIGARLT